MTDREKLTELLWEAWRIAEETCARVCCCDCEGRNAHSSRCMTVLAVDHLLANGVTLRQWTPASEPPKDDGCVFVRTAKGSHFVTSYNQKFRRWRCAQNIVISHWMPLPKPPKEG